MAYALSKDGRECSLTVAKGFAISSDGKGLRCAVSSWATAGPQVRGCVGIRTLGLDHRDDTTVDPLLRTGFCF